MSKAVLASISIVALLVVVLVLSALAMRDGVGTFIVLVIVIVVALFAGLVLFRLYAFTVISIKKASREEKQDAYHHAQAMAEKGIVVVGWEFPEYRYKNEPRIEAPKTAVDAKYTDPRREVAIKLLEETIQSRETKKDGSRKYGPECNQIMTQADAGAVGIIANDWSAAVSYLCSNYDVLTIEGKGTYTTHGKTIGRIMADTAVMSLPESKR